MPPILSTRALNRATLARQRLLYRHDGTALQAIEHLVGLQAQAPIPPYFGLWCRLERFAAGELSAALLERRAVRMALLRNTVHLVSARDALPLRTLLQPVFDRALRNNASYAAALAGLDLTDLAERGQELLGTRALTSTELRPLLAGLYPDRDPQALVQALRNLLPLVQVPPRGVRGQGGQPTLMTATGWLGPTLNPAEGNPTSTLETLVRRYLGAFGPASVKDLQVWCGLTHLRGVLERLRPHLLTFRDEAGTELFDLPEAPRPPETTPAPARLLAAFDNLLLSHADRRRFMTAPAHQRLFSVKNGIFPHTFLLDGFVAGTWTLDQRREAAQLTIEPFGELSDAARSALTAEADRLLALAAADAGQTDVVFIDPRG
ncbi:winged helix DNA-binding domain-containing protein [Deinococcus sp. KSM4-11]|uniref:winged helix DNA-binding domain-containing protein n=1 Tax=Deinococcus sp. KSM4-11 TaxID=2568654 RepID=UPI0010A39697|nr:winged helix DNA-binding domain-containing protein [Deinococcus sp. KSM4-11]THF84798.1 winged helix DNA-binding domain-containing protein [Deinococcus sp. KSM4-11]